MNLAGGVASDTLFGTIHYTRIRSIDNAVSPAPLTSTSYAVLGLLALRPWTTYELAKQIQRGMRLFWPRAESRIYDEPPKLVAAGFARAKKDTVGKRPRTTYSITAKGRRALRDWLAVDADPPQLEFEGLLKVLFADHGDRASLLAHLDAARRWSEERQTEDANLVQDYLRDGGPFPERLPIVIVTGRLLTDFARLVGEWAAWAEQQAQSWPDDIAAATPDQTVMERIAGYQAPSNDAPSTSAP